MKLEFNDWRYNSNMIIKDYKVLLQRQLYDVLIKRGNQISYQKFNDYQRENTLINRARLFESSNALVVMLKGTKLNRWKCLDTLLMNSFLIKNDLKPVYVHDNDFYRGTKALVNTLCQMEKITETQKHAMQMQLNLYRSFLVARREVLKGNNEASETDQTLFNSLYQRGIHFRTAIKDTLHFVLPDKHNNLSVSKIVHTVVDLQEQYEDSMQIPLKICLDVICITERKKEQLQKQFDHDFAELYRREVIKRKKIFIKDPTVNIHSSDLEKYVSNIDRYIIS